MKKLRAQLKCIEVIMCIFKFTVPNGGQLKLVLEQRLIITQAKKISAERAT